MLRTVPPETLSPCCHSHSPVPDPVSGIQTAGNASCLSGPVRIRSMLPAGFGLKGAGQPAGYAEADDG